VPVLDVSLCAILDPGVESILPLEEFTQRIISGGATSIQVRLKTESTRGIMDFTRRVLETCAGTGVAVIVNDRVDVALATGADGVHLGQEDMPVERARSLVGPGMIIGASVRDVSGALAAAAAGADYLGVGAMFRTPIKPEQEPISLDILQEIRHEVILPIVAIGGIDEKNAALLLEHGADGIAVISALRKCLDPKEGASRLRAAVDNFKKR